MAVLCAALALLLAPLHIVLRDIEQGIGPILTIVFYVTPILYPLALVPEPLRPWLAWNPMTYPVERLHAAWLQGALPSAMDGVYFAATLLCFAAGWWVFNRIAPHFEDLL
jgi:ABC-type polysaccharide/polyol phosphate export permease